MFPIVESAPTMSGTLLQLRGHPDDGGLDHRNSNGVMYCPWGLFDFTQTPTPIMFHSSAII